MIVAIIAFVVLLMVLVVLHEFGHFYLARKAGVTVHEFAVGMGPRIRSFGKDKRGTEFTLRLLPLGGFVRIKGESPEEDGATSANDSFICAKFWWKVAILLGGIIMNILTAWVIFVVGFVYGVKPIQIVPENAMKVASKSYLMPSITFLEEQGLISGTIQSEPVVIDGIEHSLLASQLGLQTGDTILYINDVEVTSTTIQAVLQENIGKDIVIKYKRGDETHSVSGSCDEDSCVLGIILSGPEQRAVSLIKFSVGKAIVAGFHEVKEQARITFSGLRGLLENLFTGNGEKTVAKLSGPVGAAKVGQYVLQAGGLIQFLMFGGLISMALAIFNLLPIPALDGGRLLGVIIQKLFKLPVKKYFSIEGRINVVFFFTLLILGFYIMAQDLVKAWGVHIPGIG